MKNLTIILPNALHSTDHQHPKQLPLLTKLLSRGEKVLGTFYSQEQLLYDLFEIYEVDHYAIAAICAHGDGLAPGYWLRADPVEITANLETIFMVGNQHLALTQEEADSMVSDLNQLLQLDDMQLFAPHPHRWYLRLPQAPQADFALLSATINRNLQGFLPKGPQRQYWVKLLTEMQMILSANRANQQRQQQHQPSVGSVWFYGYGELPTVPTGTWQQVFANDHFTQALASLSKTKTEPVPHNVNELMINLVAQNNLMVCYDITIEQFEQAWLPVLFKALTKNKIDTLRLFIGNKKLYVCSHQQAKRWWRFNKSLEKLL